MKRVRADGFIWYNGNWRDPKKVAAQRVRNNVAARSLRASDPRYRRTRHARAGIDVTHPNYAALAQRQLDGGGCDIRGCGRLGKNLDHDHTTGRPRGLLCWGHNVGIGKLGDGSDVRAALEYLNRSSR